MTDRITADIAVVGLGAMGAATLYQLASRGIDVVGIDRHAPPHALGSSHGETRITRCGVGEGQAYVPLVLASHRIWRQLEAETGESLLEQCGCLIMSSRGGSAVHHGKADFAAHTIASARAFDIRHELLDGDEIARRFPQLERIEDAEAYFEPGGGFVRPERCIEVQLSLAQRSGARMLQAGISEIKQNGDSVRILAGDQVIEAAQAVVAAGSWTAPLLGAPFDQLLTVRRQVLHWFPIAGPDYEPDRFPTIIWMHDEVAGEHFYGFPSLPGSGLLKAATEQYETATRADTLDRSIGPGEAASFHRRHLAGRLAGVGAEAAKSAVCAYTVTPDGGFIIDRHPEMDRVTAISACSGHGFKHSAGIGEQVALSLTGGGESALLAPFGLQRFA